MKLELPRQTERLGSIKINDLQRVLLLDSAEDGDGGQTGVSAVPREKIHEIERNMAIVIPVKDEKIQVLEGVIGAIPSECLVIVVSNSGREPVDMFRTEQEMVEQHVHFTKREVWIVHQSDPGIGKALKNTHYKEILNDEGSVRDGKGEGMVIGMMLAKAAGKEYVAFVDADNYFPGAVHEYVSVYAAAFHLSRSPYAMVRISWASKPKIQDGSLYFSKWGRISAVNNMYLNKLISSHTGFDTEIVKTANSGDHAMTMKLAEMLDYRQAFGIETYEIVDILEKFGGILKPTHTKPMEEGVEIFQMETLDPHFHEDKGEKHLGQMLADSLLSIMGSPLCTEALGKEVEAELPKEFEKREKIIGSFMRVDTEAFLQRIIKNGSILMFG